ncbi:Cytochrome c2 [Thalassovita gelatinovora]|uniref:Cytochrome c2 n=1 Tax=Thalassovita gelatinovora TaxID=53501 RepID=A0A0P1FEG7_THAGE|nr:c-type cytochrome [Thalassovita gelatinovora]QIZ79921.1 c-type cytochrome [Thalassovita gelatinovora]CUH66431.1 Cytochrome c2 [Thalassovita gelatinovora]SER14119.1 sulfur dehydrogenase subunit SoxD [Thalassovita gelatinovora]
MSKYRNFLIGSALAALTASPALAEKYGIGRPALPEEVAAWDHDISPDGTGLPVGSGSVEDGEAIFSENCAICHGEFAEGVDNWPKLAGGDGTLADKDPLKTVGSYWPYLSTVYDYVRRSMPFGAAQTMSDDDVYAITAYILYSNYIVEDDFVLSNENFLDVEMPNAGGFIVDDRETAEASFWTEPCMKDCKEGEVKITMRATVLNVTPEEEGAAEEAPAEPAAPVEEAKAEEPAAEPVVEEAAALDPELVKDGEKVFKKCKACHQVGEGAQNKTGPMLNGVVGGPVAVIEDFKYSKGMKEFGDSGETWTDENLAAFLSKPKDFIAKTKMSFVGLKKEKDIAAVTEYLKSVSQ